MAEAGLGRRDQIVAVAARLFRERGYHATSVRDIADAVGIQGGSLYAHVAGKDDLLWEIVNRSADLFFAAMQPIVDSDRTIVLKIRDAITAHVRVITDDLDAAAVYSTEWRHLPEDRREAFAARRDAYESLFRKLIGSAIRERFITATDEAFASLFVLSALNWIYQWYRPGGRLTADDVGSLMADYVLDGLRRRTA